MAPVALELRLKPPVDSELVEPELVPDLDDDGAYNMCSCSASDDNPY